MSNISATGGTLGTISAEGLAIISPIMYLHVNPTCFNKTNYTNDFSMGITGPPIICQGNLMSTFNNIRRYNQPCIPTITANINPIKSSLGLFNPLHK
jgi:hypothetical protein